MEMEPDTKTELLTRDKRTLIADRAVEVATELALDPASLEKQYGDVVVTDGFMGTVDFWTRFCYPIDTEVPETLDEWIRNGLKWFSCPVQLATLLWTRIRKDKQKPTSVLWNFDATTRKLWYHPLYFSIPARFVEEFPKGATRTQTRSQMIERLWKEANFAGFDDEIDKYVDADERPDFKAVSDATLRTAMKLLDLQFTTDRPIADGYDGHSGSVLTLKWGPLHCLVLANDRVMFYDTDSIIPRFIDTNADPRKNSLFMTAALQCAKDSSKTQME